MAAEAVNRMDELTPRLEDKQTKTKSIPLEPPISGPCIEDAFMFRVGFPTSDNIIKKISHRSFKKLAF